MQRVTGFHLGVLIGGPRTHLNIHLQTHYVWNMAGLEYINTNAGENMKPI